MQGVITRNMQLLIRCIFVLRDKSATTPRNGMSARAGFCLRAGRSGAVTRLQNHKGLSGPPKVET